MIIEIRDTKRKGKLELHAYDDAAFLLISLATIGAIALGIAVVKIVLSLIL